MSVKNACLFCGRESEGVDHLAVCDGRQGWATPDFDGETYDPDRDHGRLSAQLARVRAALADGSWHTLSELEARTQDEKQSISARIRDLRKPKFGGYHVARRYVTSGLWEYRWIKDEPVVTL